MYTYRTKGTCSSQILIEMKDEIIEKVQFVGGCTGNTQGVARLAEGRRIDDVIDLLKGIQCRGGTSCPDQLSRALEEIKAQHPELYKQIRDEGREEGLQAGMTQERNRIKAIEEMALTGHEALVAKAKFETGMTAEQMAVEMIKAEKAKTATMAQNRAKDAEELKDVGSATASVDATPSMTAEEKERAELLKGANDRLTKMHKTMEG